MRHADDCHNSAPDPFDTEAWKGGLRLHKCTCGLTAIRAKAALADAMWNHLDIMNAPLDAYERSWAEAYEAIR